MSKNLAITEMNHTAKLAEKLGVDLNLLRTKGIYPYQWVDDVNKFTATQLPDISDFHSDLTDEDCKPKDYEHAMDVWTALYRTPQPSPLLRRHRSGDAWRRRRRQGEGAMEGREEGEFEEIDEAGDVTRPR